MKDERKSRYYGKFVKVIRRKPDGTLEVREGILRGYLKSLVFIDTGDIFFEQFPVGTAPGHWLVMPAKTKLEIIKAPQPVEEKPVVVRKKVAPRVTVGDLADISSYDSSETESSWQPNSWYQELEDLPEYYPVTPVMDAEAFNEFAE